MCGADLKEIMARIKPKALFSIHTEKPVMFCGLNGKAVMVKEGKEYDCLTILCVI